MHIKTSDQPRLRLGFGDYSCNWGVHIAGLYETSEERDNIILNFLHQGHIDGDLQLFCPAERSEHEFREELTQHCPECASDLDNPDRFQLFTAKDVYFPDGEFSVSKTEAILNVLYQQLQSAAPRKIRAAVEMTWVNETVPGIKYLMAYEARLNYFIPGKSWVSICMYNLNTFDGATIMNVLRTHPYTISGGVITENPYYQDASVWLKNYAPEFLSTES